MENKEQAAAPVATKHPERKPGMRLKSCGWVLARIKACPWNTCEEHWEFEDGNGMCLNALLHNGFQSAPSEPSARTLDRSKCKPWCGGLSPWGPGSNADDQFAYWATHLTQDDPAARRGPHYCSGVCRDAAAPPLSAQGEAWTRGHAPDHQCDFAVVKESGTRLHCQGARGHDGEHTRSAQPPRSAPAAEPAKAEPLFLVTTCGVRFRAELHAEYATHMLDCRTCRTRRALSEPQPPPQHEPMCHPGTCLHCDSEFSRGRKPKRPSGLIRLSHSIGLEDDCLAEVGVR